MKNACISVIILLVTFTLVKYLIQGHDMVINNDKYVFLKSPQYKVKTKAKIRWKPEYDGETDIVIPTSATCMLNVPR